MKELIPMDDMGVMVSRGREEVLVDSRMVAEVFEKRHDHVYRDIEKLICVESHGTKDLPKSGEMPELENTEMNATKSGLSMEFV
ncbi:MAG: Rha family transcriptional regulator, partial [Blautia sp.]|nr:Rha family transcriptional regulator [Blautia sp.]